MMHEYHEGLPGFDARQIWYDGCEECEHRSVSVPSSVVTLDTNNLARAWVRMRDWDTGGSIGPLSKAELPLLRYLESVRLTAQAMNRVGVNPAL